MVMMIMMSVLMNLMRMMMVIVHNLSRGRGPRSLAAVKVRQSDPVTATKREPPQVLQPAAQAGAWAAACGLDRKYEGPREAAALLHIARD